ncbi:MAG: class I SAM-dependent methyltransferase [Thermoleophilia bacterium]
MNEEPHRHSFAANSELRADMKSAILDLMQLSPDDIVADLGSGEGFYAVEFAQRAKTVYAVDVDPRALASPYLDRPGIVKVEAHLCNDFALPADVTHVFFSNSFHDVDCRDSLLHNIATALKPGSHLTMVEFKLDTPFGPPKSMRLAKDHLRSLVEAHGFRQRDEREFDYHYALTFERL